MNSKKKWNEIRNESKPKKNEILKLNENDFYLKVFFLNFRTRWIYSSLLNHLFLLNLTFKIYNLSDSTQLNQIDYLSVCAHQLFWWLLSQRKSISLEWGFLCNDADFEKILKFLNSTKWQCNLNYFERRKLIPSHWAVKQQYPTIHVPYCN